MQLRYGMNPQQSPASVEPIGAAPCTVVHGHPSYLNLLDAISAWQLVREASAGAGMVAAASFKHVSPAGAALAGPIDPVTARLFEVDSRADAVTRAYARARDADPKSSYGDMVAVSAPVTVELAAIPLSADYLAFAGGDIAARLAAATAGDDYELLFALPGGDEPPIGAVSVGRFDAGSGIALTWHGASVPLPASLGFQH